jgi:hypothetical protein
MAIMKDKVSRYKGSLPVTILPYRKVNIVDTTAIKI